jgi:hypothetical protein
MPCGASNINCHQCPTTCQGKDIHNLNGQRINRQVRMSGSLQIFKKKAAAVSRMVGQSAFPSHLSQVGGPGDLISSINLKKKSGVDKKHGSYARFLARKTGGVLRAEQMDAVRQKTAYIHQPRNRTGTGVSCGGGLTTTKYFCALGDICCKNRIPSDCKDKRITCPQGNPGVGVSTKCGCCSK